MIQVGILHKSGGIIHFLSGMHCPQVLVGTMMENHHFGQVNHPWFILYKWTIFHGYVKQPKGIIYGIILWNDQQDKSDDWDQWEYCNRFLLLSSKLWKATCWDAFSENSGSYPRCSQKSCSLSLWIAGMSQFLS